MKNGLKNPKKVTHTNTKHETEREREGQRGEEKQRVEGGADRHNAKTRCDTPARTNLAYSSVGGDMGDVDEVTADIADEDGQLDIDPEGFDMMDPTDDDGGQLDIGPEVFDIYSSHLASCLADENDKLEGEIRSLYPFRDYLSSVEIRVDDRTIKLPGLEESLPCYGGTTIKFDAMEEQDVPGIPVASMSNGNVGLYISSQLVGRLPEEFDEGGTWAWGQSGGVCVFSDYTATLTGKSESVNLHGRLEGLTEEHYRSVSDTWAVIRRIPNITFHPTNVDVGRASQNLVVSSAKDVRLHCSCERLDRTDRERQVYKEQLDDVKEMVRDIECVDEDEYNMGEVARIKETISKLTEELERQIKIRDFIRENILNLLGSLDCDIAGKEDPTSDECEEEIKALHIVFGIAGGKGLGLTRRRVNLKEQVSVLERIRGTVLIGHLHTALGGFCAIDIHKGKVKDMDGDERWVVGLQGIFGTANLRKLSHLHLCLCGVITRDVAVTVVMLPETPFEALAQYRYANGVTASCFLQLEFAETNAKVDIAVGEQLYRRLGEGLELAVEYKAKVIPITVELPMDNGIVSFVRRMFEAE